MKIKQYLVNHALYIISFLFLLTSFYSCKNKSQTNDDAVVQKTETTADTTHSTPPPKKVITPEEFTYTKIKNDRFNFTFEIPNTWKAADKSNNGDGFYIETGNVNADLRIYGETITGIDDIDYAGIKCDGVSEFIFKDETKGTKCSGSGLLYYFYIVKKKRITLYLNAPPEWRKENIQVLEYIAKSISVKNPS